MSGLDDNGGVMGELVTHCPNQRALRTPVSNEEISSKSLIKREVSSNPGQIRLEDIGEEDASHSFQLGEERTSSRGGGSLGERVAARSGFNDLKLNTENFRVSEFSLNQQSRSPRLTISSPGLSPATLLESPVFLSNSLAQPSPTTGRFSLFPGGNNNTMPLDPPDTAKDEFFDNIGTSFTFQPGSQSSSSLFPATTTAHNVVGHSRDISVDYDNRNRSQSMESIKPVSQKTEGLDLYANFAGTSAERHSHDGEETEPEEQRTIYTEPEEPREEEEEGRTVGDLVAGGAPADDGYNWRKYGQKLVKGSEYPRSYYKCTHPNCLVKKKVERSREGHITEIIYKGAHNHPKPTPNRRSGVGSFGASLEMQMDGTDPSEQQRGMGRDSAWAGTQQAGKYEDVEERSPASEGFEYGNQSGQMQVQGGLRFESSDAAGVADASPIFSNDEDEDDRGTHGSVSLGYEGEGDETESKRRKLEAYAAEINGATRAIREPRVVVQTTSDVDILEDGYRWRKYGQKVVKGNPNPRSYYKCTAPGCTVRKHVERASHDLKSVITTYEGKHNHGVPAARNSSHAGAGSSSITQSGSATQHQTEPRNRFERPGTSNPPPPFNHPFTFQPQFGPPPGFSFRLGQTGLHNLSFPGLTFGQGKLASFPAHPYLAAQQQPQPQPRQPTLGEPGLMLQRGAEPKVEPGSETGPGGVSGSSSIYEQIMSRLPQI